MGWVQRTSKSEGSAWRRRFLGNSLTGSRSTKGVLRFKRWRGRVRSTRWVQMMEEHKRITSGCSSQRSWGLGKKVTPSCWAVREWSEREWARTVWPWRTRVWARNCPRLPKPTMAIYSFWASWNCWAILDS
ncbi:hypothetical protein JHK82_039594 [Glycine max]|uniref:Uncharacterized protein n=2 Tax=Glycine subgen. Soja TaxID=1462606 RepID=A0A0R0GMB9_SOYBN|nr:hypothetical protein JHK87_039575 [Glycine soja]KAG4962914.1 hypothetical protein JHK86_039782 [Glycine max]KAG4965386.1 hypothetical protein JHK85_040361 [Glycine max]KAG5110371.1 hypothetical protein JHK82_039594 [Glycine max]KAG5121657.1 hypothetical protein JHK84_039997 [Glycine max]